MQVLAIDIKLVEQTHWLVNGLKVWLLDNRQDVEEDEASQLWEIGLKMKF